MAQEPLLKVIFSAFLFLLHLLFWVAEVFLLACIFMRIHLTPSGSDGWATFPLLVSSKAVPQLSSPGCLGLLRLCPGRLELHQQLCSARYGKSRTLIPFLKNLQFSILWPSFEPSGSSVACLLLPGQKCWPSASSLEVTSHTCVQH